MVNIIRVRNLRALFFRALSPCLAGHSHDDSCRWVHCKACLARQCKTQTVESCRVQWMELMNS